MRDRLAPDHIRRLQQHAREQTTLLLGHASRHFGCSMPHPEIRFDLRGIAAGQARAGDAGGYLIRYNLSLLTRHPRDFIARTVPHETAHIVAFRLFGHRASPHGAEWRSVMQLFGAAPRRCHDYDVDGLQTRTLRRYRYRCNCRSHELTSIRHNRARQGQVYLCRRCGQALVFDRLISEA